MIAGHALAIILPYELRRSFRVLRAFVSGSTCETANHQGHKGPRRKTLTHFNPKILRDTLCPSWWMGLVDYSPEPEPLHYHAFTKLYLRLSLAAEHADSVRVSTG